MLCPNPLVSIIVPIYNGQDYLDACLRSLVSQSYKNIEIITVNDGSTDGTAQILSDFAKQDNRVKVFTTANGGVSAARNTGMQKARGIYIMFCDSDDLIAPDCVRMLLSGAQGHKADISCCRITNSLKRLHSGTSKMQIKSGEKVAEELLYQSGRITLSPCGAIFDKKLFEKVGEFNPNIRYEDLELIPQIYAAANKVAITDYFGYYYRQHDNSFIHRFTPQRFDSLKAVDTLQQKLSARSATLQKAVADRQFSAAYNVFLLASKRAEYTPVAQRCWHIILENRWSVLLNSRTRLKNKLGAILSFAGYHIVAMFASKR